MTADLRTLKFTDSEGNPAAVADWLGNGESVLLVFLRHLG